MQVVLDEENFQLPKTIMYVCESTKLIDKIVQGQEAKLKSMFKKLNN